MPATTAIPLNRAHAMQILAAPHLFGKSASLVALARQIAASPIGVTLTRNRLRAPRGILVASRPVLRVIEGGKQ